MSPRFEHTDELDWNVRRVAKYTTERGELTSYSVTLLARLSGRWQTVRVYDNAHGVNEMHRHTLSEGKQAAEVFHSGTASEAYNQARDAVADGYEEMIAGWLR
jgi:hypothetical protein